MGTAFFIIAGRKPKEMDKEIFAFHCLFTCNLFEENVMSTAIGSV